MQHISKLVLFASKLALVASVSFLWSSSSQAQAVAKAEIPFDFVCHGQVMPRGAYTISIVLEKFFELRSSDGKSSVVSLIESHDKVASPGTKLIFHRYGDSYFLSEFQSETLELELKLPKSKAEQQAQLNEAGLYESDTALMSHSPQYLVSVH